MAMDFSSFDKQVDINKLKADVQEAHENPSTGSQEVPAGEYMARIENIELGQTKDGRPMFKVMMRLNTLDMYQPEDKDILTDETEAFLKRFKPKKGCCVFMNRVIFGTKNDGNMIESVLGWIRSLEPEVDPVFSGYADLANYIMDLAEEVVGTLDIHIDYDDTKFNSISVKEVFEI